MKKKAIILISILMVMSGFFHIYLLKNESQKLDLAHEYVAGANKNLTLATYNVKMIRSRMKNIEPRHHVELISKPLKLQRETEQIVVDATSKLTNVLNKIKYYKIVVWVNLIVFIFSILFLKFGKFRSAKRDIYLADEILKLHELKKQGILSEDEYLKQKKKLL